MTLSNGDETRITDTIKTLKYAETSSYTHTKAPMTVNTKEQKTNFKRNVGTDSHSTH